MAQSNAGRVDGPRYAALLLATTRRSSEPARALCSLAARTTRMSGAGLSIARDDVLECVAVSDELTGRVEAIEYTVGEGPCVSAHQSAAPMSDADVGSSDPVEWPLFRHEVVGLPIGAAYGFPLLGAAGCFGSLNLYRRARGPMTSDEHADALVITHVSGRLVLDWQAAAAPDRLAWQLEQSSSGSVQIHQAAGRIAVQAGVPIADALATLRAYAFANERLIVDVAREVAEGNLKIV